MNALATMQERRARGIPDEAKAIKAKAETEGREITDAEVDQLEALAAEQDALGPKIEAEQRRLRAVARFGPTGKPAAGGEKPATVIEVGAGPERRPFVNFGEFGLAVRAAMSGGGMDERLKPLAPLDPQAAISGASMTIPSDGGFLVPPSYSQGIWDGMNEAADALIARVDSYPVDGYESLTFNANGETTRASSVYGGVIAYFKAEADQMTASKPKFRQVTVKPNALYAFCYATDELLRNASAFNAWLQRAAIDALNWKLNSTIVGGTGAGQPRGIISAPSTVSVAKETNQAAVSIVAQNISKMWARLHPAFRARAIWLHNVDVEPALDTLATLVKNVAATENVGGFADKVFDPERRTLKGRPIVAQEWCETLGTVGDLILWDPKSYLACVRGLQSATSMHLRFDYGETAFRFQLDVDGTPWLASALTPAKGSNTLTSQVTLATRA